MGFQNINIKTERVGNQKYRLLENLVYKGETDAWLIPAGYETDYATIPAFITGLFPKDSDYTLATIVHDYFCSEGIQKGVITARDTDAVFRRIMRELGVHFTRRWTIWVGVRWGALFNETRRKDIQWDMPLVLFLSLILAPVIAPIAITTWFGLFLDWLGKVVFDFFGVK